MHALLLLYGHLKNYCPGERVLKCVAQTDNLDLIRHVPRLSSVSLFNLLCQKVTRNFFSDCVWQSLRYEEICRSWRREDLRLRRPMPIEQHYKHLYAASARLASKVFYIFIAIAAPGITPENASLPNQEGDVGNQTVCAVLSFRSSNKLGHCIQFIMCYIICTSGAVQLVRQ
jgi:hypothetical protein